MEYCEGGDLATLVKEAKSEKKHIPEEKIWRIFTQALLALKAIHKNEGSVILHRDLKPGNLFLDSEHNLKLGDFGLARVLNDESLYAHTYVGTPYYM